MNGIHKFKVCRELIKFLVKCNNYVEFSSSYWLEGNIFTKDQTTYI